MKYGLIQIWIGFGLADVLILEDIIEPLKLELLLEPINAGICPRVHHLLLIATGNLMIFASSKYMNMKFSLANFFICPTSFFSFSFPVTFY